MKYRHFPAAALAAGLLFCTLFSGLTAYADDKKSELTQKQTETQQEYEAAQSAAVVRIHLYAFRIALSTY